jgi:hypothetical protein
MSSVCSTGLVGLNEHNLMFYRTRPPFMAERQSKGDLQFHTYSFALLSALCPVLMNINSSSSNHFYQSGEFSFPCIQKETRTRDFHNAASEEKVPLFVL